MLSLIWWPVDVALFPLRQLFVACGSYVLKVMESCGWPGNEGTVFVYHHSILEKSHQHSCSCACVWCRCGGWGIHITHCHVCELSRQDHMKFHMSSLVLATYPDGYKSCTHKAYHYQADVSIWTFIQDSIPRKKFMPESQLRSALSLLTTECSFSKLYTDLDLGSARSRLFSTKVIFLHRH